MKSVQWKHVASGVLKYCTRGLLGSFHHKTLMELCNVLSMLVAEEIDMSCIDDLKYRTHRVLALLECDFPVSLNVIVFHLLHHLPMYLRRFSPAYIFWMYPLERFNSDSECIIAGIQRLLSLRPINCLNSVLFFGENSS